MPFDFGGKSSDDGDRGERELFVYASLAPGERKTFARNLERPFSLGRLLVLCFTTDGNPASPMGLVVEQIFCDGGEQLSDLGGVPARLFEPEYDCGYVDGHAEKELRVVFENRSPDTILFVRVSEANALLFESIMFLGVEGGDDACNTVPVRLVPTEKVSTEKGVLQGWKIERAQGGRLKEVQERVTRSVYLTGFRPSSDPLNT